MRRLVLFTMVSMCVGSVLSLLLIVAMLGSTGPVEAQGGERVRQDMETGGTLNVIEKGLAMPHDHTHLGSGAIPTERYFAWKTRLRDDHAVQYFFGYTPRIQLGSRDARWLVVTALDFIGEWEPFNSPKTRGELNWWFTLEQTLTDLGTASFANTQLLTVHTNDGDTGESDLVASLATLYWEQDFLDTVGFRIGQLNTQTIWAINEFLGNDRVGFMAQPLAGPYGTAFMVNEIGLGAQVEAWNDFVYFMVGFQEATANGLYPDFKSLARGDLTHLAELGITPGFGGPYSGAYRVTYSYIGRTGQDPGEEPGHSLVVSAKQRIADAWGLFGRYTQSFRRLPQDLFRLAVVAGVVRLAPFGFSSDRVGLGYIFDRPTNASFREEHGAELYWRFQLTQLFSMTPDLQIYFRPSKAADADITTVFTLRLQVAI